MGLPVSPLCDRNPNLVDMNKSQTGFIKFVVKPMFEVFAKLLPQVREEVLPALENTLDYWENKE